ncbi:MAG: hypothetical protein COB17_00190 [Sulfurimonas sp.]|nr:MAG: hypothetical protein COB17_10165 [Sulfurimonas sp.]PHS59435.1 MAG: hypothetical protein COB17_00190 [Sulfurimonas sp.]
MEPAKAVKEYKDEVAKLKVQVGEYAKKVGELTFEKDWAVGKLKSLDSSFKKELIDKSENKIISVVKQCKLLNYNRSNLFYISMVNPIKKTIKDEIVAIFEEIPCYGYLKAHQELLDRGHNVCVNTVRANQVWSTDITYIKIKGGMVYMAAIIDWYSKAILSWRISNTMDTDLVMGVLNEALSLYGKPEIFNTNQGSQYTSYIHTQTLKDNNIIISMDGKSRATDGVPLEGIISVLRDSGEVLRLRKYILMNMREYQFLKMMLKIILNFIIIEDFMRHWTIKNL